MRKLVLLLAVSFFGVLLFVLVKSFGNDPHAVPFQLLGKPAPAFSMKRLDTGEVVRLADYLGRPVVLNFWATWCGPCKEEHPTLNAAARRFGDRVTFLGIVFEDTEENTRRFIRENGDGLVQLFDPTSTIAVDYAVSGVPETYFISRQGVIMGKVPMPVDPETLESGIQELLK